MRQAENEVLKGIKRTSTLMTEGIGGEVDQTKDHSADARRYALATLGRG